MLFDQAEGITEVFSYKSTRNQLHFQVTKKKKEQGKPKDIYHEGNILKQKTVTTKFSILT